jgi:hypothetical protein
MADMDLGLDMEGLGFSAEEMEQLVAVEPEVELAENLEGFAAGFSADWDLEPPTSK